jgi:prefoldin subunit 5
MSEHIYPVPAESHHEEELLTPFLEETVTQMGLTADEQFLIVLFGEDASERLDETEEIIKDTGPVVRKSLDLNQLSVVSIDERRLNTFTTSLLYALLETDQDQPLQNTLSSDYIADEDERKVDYYLPRLIEKVENALHEESRRFEDNLDTIFPVDPGAQRPREMNQRLEKDVVTETVIIDFMLLAAASTEDSSGVRRLLRHIREEDIDDSGMLSSKGNVSGYSRIISISYLLNKNQFNSEFRTARELYDEGATAGLLSLLNETEDFTISSDAEVGALEADGGANTQLKSFYNIEQRVEGLLTSQFQGNATTIVRRLLRTINGTRLIQNNSDIVRSKYQSQKEDIESEIAQFRGELTSLAALGDEFDETKINVNTAEPDPYEKVVSLVDGTNSLVIRFIFGFDRESRTSTFTTIEAHLREYRRTLSEYRARVEELHDEIQELEARCDQEVRRLETNYDRLESTSVEVDTPDRAQMISNLVGAWEEELAQLKHDLPKIDFTAEDEDPQASLDQWEERVSESRNQLDELCGPIDQLEQVVEKIGEIDEMRNNVRDTLSQINDTMVEQ